MKLLVKLNFILISVYMLFLPVANSAEIQGYIEFIKLEDNVVTFKTDSTAAYTQPDCALAENKGLFTLTLDTTMGRAMYAALMSASSIKKPILMNSSGSCIELQGVETVTGLTVTELNLTDTPSQSAAAKSLKLVGKAFSYYGSNGYDCRITISARNSSGQPYIFNENGNCRCRDSKPAHINLVDPQRNRNVGPAGNGTEISCYIEE
ncbi:hypothetical protein CJF42_15125 [Pseudoalteromonas sp. NBT06-2]|uniref:hypothetical protein n=1 Tax=Pseudoalteromonas sp. NBT06-2 TaxID=2025950 RepID=UPI000BA71805|nr:hypothetical protein [Pseudoalteromonas sp. NBT06-2]PAJ73593.1 hypothetical protein CJF42_15125 [Pseudoalteromonas sp. NBT06-2]